MKMKTRINHTWADKNEEEKPDEEEEKMDEEEEKPDEDEDQD